MLSGWFVSAFSTSTTEHLGIESHPVPSKEIPTYLTLSLAVQLTIILLIRNGQQWQHSVNVITCWYQDNVNGVYIDSDHCDTTGMPEYTNSSHSAFILPMDTNRVPSF